MSSALGTLRRDFGGGIIGPGSAEYESASRSLLASGHPARVLRPESVGDVQAGVRFAARSGLLLSVRGGGHGFPGLGTNDGGVVIDLSKLADVEIIDKERHLVRIGGGATWGQVAPALAPHGLAISSGDTKSVGVGGLTLTGGIGWKVRKYGLALDNVVAAEVVTANGEVVPASAGENPELFWAIRGGGGNFGIAASLEYTLHQVGPMITGGLAAHPMQKGVEVLKFFRDLCAAAPDELMMFAGLLTAPDGSGAKLVGIVPAHCGSLADGEKAVAPIKAFGPPVMDVLGPIPYCAQNSLLEAAFPKGALNYWKSSFLTDLNDAAIQTLLECFSACPSPMSQIAIEHFHGKASRIGIGDTACATRLTGFNVAIISQWMDPVENDRHMTWCRDTYDALKPYFAQMRYLNYLDNDEPGDLAAVAYGPNYGRLRELKTKYDPENFFHTNVNIRPL